jgi:hypothetical protein
MSEKKCEAWEIGQRQLEAMRGVNVLDRTEKPTPRRHTGPLKDLLLGMVIGAAIMVALFLLGWAEAAL